MRSFPFTSGSGFSGLVSQADVVLDCSDNFPASCAGTRVREHRRPLVSGAAIRFDAQLMVLI
jgi:molybdopterin/thiamine biosynthesis adenylyltransferase